MTDFRSALDFYELCDLGYVGSPFTWRNNQFDGMVTWIKLGRGVATTAWTQLFPSVRVHHIAGSLSSHCPLWVCLDDENDRFYKKGRPFRFEAVWMIDDRCEGVIKNAWDGNTLVNPMERLVRKVDVCHSSLQTWSKLSFGNIRRLLNQKKKLLAQAEALSMSSRNHDHVKILRDEIYELMVKEDCLWHQRSRVDWLKAGDLNTSYFHSRANQRNRKNFISKLVLEDSIIMEEEQGIKEAFMGYFCNLFKSASTSNFDPLVHEIELKVTT